MSKKGHSVVEFRGAISDAVPGDTDSIRQCLNWFEELHVEKRETVAAVTAALNAERCSSDSGRQTTYESAQWQLEDLAEKLVIAPFERVVAAHLAARVESLIQRAWIACSVLATDLKHGQLPGDVVDGWLANMNASEYELRQLKQFL